MLFTLSCSTAILAFFGSLMYILMTYWVWIFRDYHVLWWTSTMGDEDDNDRQDGLLRMDSKEHKEQYLLSLFDKHILMKTTTTNTCTATIT